MSRVELCLRVDLSWLGVIIARVELNWLGAIIAKSRVELARGDNNHSWVDLLG